MIRTIVLCVLLCAFFSPVRAEMQYYGMVDDSSPQALRDSLHEIIDDHKRFPYTSSSTDTWNAGLNDAWYNPETDGQGFFITVFPDLSTASIAWFTYDTALPDEGAQANLGDPGHRWITAVGPINGNRAVMNIDITSGGVFDTQSEVGHTNPAGADGTITLTFENCNSAIVDYDITSINRQGSVAVQRVAGDNMALCEALSAEQ